MSRDPSPPADGAATLAELAGELSSPVRVRILTYLLEEGPSRVREVSVALGISDSQLSNHLARLRQRGLVSVEREGRTATYTLSSPRIQELLSGLYDAIDSTPTVRTATTTGGVDPALVHARSCYDHLAGELGVTVYEALLRHEAIQVDATGDVTLGGNAEPVFIRLGVGLTALPTERRRLGFACLDWTQGKHHLGGALGAAMLTSLLDRQWLTHLPRTRALNITTEGKTGLDAALDL